jgi:monovalent cation:H+ antiporter-2, CPA2 family
VALGLGQTLLLAGAALAAYRWLVPWVTLRLHLDEEENLLFAFLLLFAFVGGATAMGLPFLVGAFFAGFSLSAFPANGLFRGTLASFSDFFIAVFFVVLGLIVALPTAASVLQALLLGLGLMLCTVVLVAFLAERTGLSARDALQTGLLLTPTSEFSLILVLNGAIAGILSDQVFALVAFLTVATMSLTPFIATPRVAGWLMRLHPRARGPKTGTAPPRDHILLVGLDYFGDHLIDSIREAGHGLVILDDDAVRVRTLCAREIDCRQFRSIDAAVLEAAGIAGARAILCAPRNAHEAFELLEHSRQRTSVRPYVRVFDEEEARAVEARGGRPIIMTERTLDGLNAWMATLRS